MSGYQHIALNGDELAMSSPIIQNLLKGKGGRHFPALNGKKGVLFSNTTLTKFIENEVLYDVYDLSSNSNRSIRTFSSGEQKKALLEYLLSQNPDFMMLDNPFDALDVASVVGLKKRLNELAKQMPMVLIFKRQSDLLPFITHGMRIENDAVVFSGSIEAYLETYIPRKPFVFASKIPEATEQYKLASETLISFKHVNVSYNKRPILNNINWEIKTGEFWQLVGPNGSGKTTMLTMINGDNPKAFGENITLFGRRKGSGENVWQLKKMMGYFTPSMMELFKHRHTAQQMVVSGMVDSIGLYKKASEYQKHVADDWLKLIGVYDKKDRAFIELSQVQRRLVLIARAMIKHPPLLILDEPSTGLDDYSASMLSALVNKMAEESSTAILYVSHRQEPDLKPKQVLKLEPKETGSEGTIIVAK